MRFLAKTKMFNYVILMNGLRKLVFLKSFETMLKISTEDLAYFFNYFNFKPPEQYYNHLDQEEIKIKLKEIQNQMKKSFASFVKVKDEILAKHKEIEDDLETPTAVKNGLLIDHVYEKVKHALHIILLGLFQYLKKKMAYRFGQKQDKNIP